MHITPANKEKAPSSIQLVLGVVRLAWSRERNGTASRTSSKARGLEQRREEEIETCPIENATGAGGEREHGYGTAGDTLRMEDYTGRGRTGVLRKSDYLEAGTLELPRRGHVLKWDEAVRAGEGYTSKACEVSQVGLRNWKCHAGPNPGRPIGRGTFWGSRRSSPFSDPPLVGSGKMGEWRQKIWSQAAQSQHSTPSVHSMTMAGSP
ncbi:hypothetical protein TREES_T100011553 [Tupaia chinensis]|uniref:Uncharacterized protein n=1 Tax=Tupaia chinensis TaxID=246437 RepID=L9L706_TUPCH|nr:hypothetical protein TREES_T100011553 [Tupaia chinensis]